MNKIYLLSIFIISTIFVQSVYAAQQIPGWNSAVNILTMITGMPTSFFDTFPEFLFHFLMPFLMIWFICLGFMKQLRIFTRAPNWIDWFISFTMSALTVYPTGLLIRWVIFFSNAGAFFSILAFFGLFIIGLWFNSEIFFRHHSGEAKTYKDLKNIEGQLIWEIHKLNLKLTAATTPAQINNIKNKLDHKEESLKLTRLKMKQIYGP